MGSHWAEALLLPLVFCFFVWVELGSRHTDKKDEEKVEDEPSQRFPQPRCPVCFNFDSYPSRQNSLDRVLQLSFVVQAVKKRQCLCCIFLCRVLDAYYQLLEPNKSPDYRITEGVSLPKHRRYQERGSNGEGPSLTIGTTRELFVSSTQDCSVAVPFLMIILSPAEMQSCPQRITDRNYRLGGPMSRDLTRMALSILFEPTLKDASNAINSVSKLWRFEIALNA